MSQPGSPEFRKDLQPTQPYNVVSVELEAEALTVVVLRIPRNGILVQPAEQTGRSLRRVGAEAAAEEIGRWVGRLIAGAISILLLLMVSLLLNVPL